jgi:hypothetical protein
LRECVFVSHPKSESRGEMSLPRIKNKKLVIERSLLFVCVIVLGALYVLASENTVFGNGNRSVVIEDIDGLKIPIHDENEELERFLLKDGKIRGVSYQIAEPFPAPKVIAFYEQEMKQLGFREITSGTLDKDKTMGNWRTYIDSTTSESFYVAEYALDWADINRSARVSLMLRYQTVYNEERVQVVNYEDWLYLKVIIQKMPFFLLPGEDTFVKTKDVRK